MTTVTVEKGAVPGAEEPPDTGARHKLTAVTGLAALSLDAMASVAYGPEAIVLVLAAVGGYGLGFTLPVTSPSRGCSLCWSPRAGRPSPCSRTAAVPTPWRRRTWDGVRAWS